MLFEISIDEVAWRKGHRYLTLVGDHRRGCVVWGTEGKGQAAADQFFSQLDPPRPDPPAHAGQPSWQPVPAIMVPFGPCPTVPAGDGIPGAWLQDGSELEPAIFARASRLSAVSMDMTGGYAKSVREHAPQATIVIDNYHVVALATKALDEVRREHWNELRHAGTTDAAKQFKADRWALLRNPDDLTDRQATILAAIQVGGGKVARAWAMKEMVRAIFAPGLTVEAVGEAARPAPGPPLTLPPETVHPTGTHDPKTPRGHPRRPPPEAQQRPSRSAKQQGEADRSPRVRVPLPPKPHSPSYTSPAARSR